MRASIFLSPSPPQPKVTNRAGCRSAAFSNLPLLRVTTEDDMVQFFGTADPISAR